MRSPTAPRSRTLVELARRLGIESWEDALKSLIDQARANDIAPRAPSPRSASATRGTCSPTFPAPSTEDLDASLVSAIEAAVPELREARHRQEEHGRIHRACSRNVAAWFAAAPRPGPTGSSSPRARRRRDSRPIAQPVTDIAESLRPRTRGCGKTSSGISRRSSRSVQRRWTPTRRESASWASSTSWTRSTSFSGCWKSPRSSRRCREELDLLLVDEFQDTSPIQLELFVRLSRIARETVWVGDVKQAIYGFRGSDAELMKAVLAKLPALGRHARRFSAQSRRSRPNLVRLVNGAFGDAFAPGLSRARGGAGAVRKELVPDAALANWVLNGKNVTETGCGTRRGHQGARCVRLSHRRSVKRKPSTRALRRHRGALQDQCGRADGGASPSVRFRAMGHAAVRLALDARGRPGARVPASTQRPARHAGERGDRLAGGLRGARSPGWRIACAISKAGATAACGGTAPRAVTRCFRESRGCVSRRRCFRRTRRWSSSSSSATSLDACCAGGANELVAQRAPREPRKPCWPREDLRGRVPRAARAGDGLRPHSLARGAGQRELDMLAQPPVDAVKVMTHHAAKGLEWPIVVLLDLEKDIQDRALVGRRAFRGRASTSPRR